MEPVGLVLLFFFSFNQTMNLSDRDAAELFASHVPLGRCKPGQLFVLPKITKQGLSSCWAVMVSHYNILSEILDVTKGFVPCQKSLTAQFKTFLANSSMTWSVNDLEKSTYHLRSMLRSLRNLKSAPRGYEKLDAIISKFDRSRDADGEEEVDNISHDIVAYDDDDDYDDDDAAGVSDLKNHEYEVEVALHPLAAPFKGFTFNASVEKPWSPRSKKQPKQVEAASKLSDAEIDALMAGTAGKNAKPLLVGDYAKLRKKKKDNKKQKKNKKAEAAKAAKAAKAPKIVG